jgi:hypothetical protein
MDRIVIKRNGELAVMVARPFPEERQEEYLHRILESEPQFVAPRDNESDELLPIVVVASKLKLPSGDELDLLLLDSRGVFTLCELKKERWSEKPSAKFLTMLPNWQKWHGMTFKSKLTKPARDCVSK